MTHNISIIIPHYQKQRTLQQVFDELQLQLHPNDEIIISDDHSPEGVPEFDCNCTETIRPPKHTPHTYRLCTLRNYGLKHATHDCCIILDPDCIPNPRFLDYARKMYDPNVLFTGCIDKIQKDGSIKPDGRRNSGRSYWADGRDKNGGIVWGGVMMFSKSRTQPLGWFDEAFNGVWGAEDAEFGSKCYHSGMRLRFSMELKVTHLYHPKKTEGYPRNREIWLHKAETHHISLNNVTDYKPAVGVMVITMMRPDTINQCLQAIFRNRIPLKVRLINNGDDTEDTRRICEEWGRRWAVDYIHHDRKWPAQVRNDSMRWAQGKGYKYLVFIDDDIIVSAMGITRLVSSMEERPDIYALSGKIITPNNAPWLLGGPLRNNMFYKYTDRTGLHISDWVGGGFTCHRIDPLLLYDEDYETGFNDYDWSMNAKKGGYKLATTGDARAWHAFKLTARGMERYKNSPDYNKIRYDRERHHRMRKLFEDKWGFWLEGGALTNG